MMQQDIQSEATDITTNNMKASKIHGITITTREALECDKRENAE